MERRPRSHEIITETFRRGSTTFFLASRFFTPTMRDAVSKLYAFVRIADDYVDVLPAKPESLAALHAAYNTKDASSLPYRDRVITEGFLEVAEEHRFQDAWVSAFFDSMRADIDPPTYTTLDDTLKYIYGSAEVIGLMMARVMGAPEHTLKEAALLGRGYQYLNMLRDIGVDQKLGRTYIPQELLMQVGLSDLTEDNTRANPKAFTLLMEQEVARYIAWQEAGMQGVSSLPKPARVAISLASDGFARTARTLLLDPFIVYRQVVKPSKAQLLLRLPYALLTS